jgi:hypothetical protein
VLTITSDIQPEYPVRTECDLDNETEEEWTLVDARARRSGAIETIRT